MRRLLMLLALTVIGTWSCTPDERIVAEQEVVFSISVIPLKKTIGGRITANADPKSVVVTIKDNTGNIVANRIELALHKFGENFLSVPLTLKTNGTSLYNLTEFFVMNSDSEVSHATPREGSELAHLISDPLDIEFMVSKDVITTVTPEVLSVGENANPSDFGYSQFGFKEVATINAVFSAFIKGENNFELTDAHLTIQGLKNSTSADTTVLWTYQADLEVKANTFTLKKADKYRITAKKQGCATWTQTLFLDEGSKVEIVLDKPTILIDAYVAGYEKNENGIWVAKYWKNGQAVSLSDGSKNNYACSIYISDGDVYVAGHEGGTDPFITSTGLAKYWKNGTATYLPGKGKYTKTEAKAIVVSGSDVYVAGIMYSANNGQDPQPVYWKNGNLISLTDESYEGYAEAIAIDGNDVYVAGYYNGYNRGCYWKNGVKNSLTAGAGTKVYPKNIIAHKGEIFVCGTYYDHNENGRAIYWKNDIAFPIQEPSTFSIAFSIAISDNVVHMVGREESSGRHWKNGNKISIDDHGIFQYMMTSVATLDNHISMAGVAAETFNGTAMAYQWVNGTPEKLGHRESSARSIFLVKR